MSVTSSNTKESLVSTDRLSVEQLGQVKKQFDEELEHLTASYARLQGARMKFEECLGVVQSPRMTGTVSNTILVPLTNSLYVSGNLLGTENVLIDVGTGYLVEQSTTSAVGFYKAKVESISRNMHDLENIIQQKTGQARAIDEAIQHRL